MFLKVLLFLNFGPKRDHLGAKMVPEGILAGSGSLWVTWETGLILDLVFREHLWKSYSFTQFGSRSEIDRGSSGSAGSSGNSARPSLQTLVSLRLRPG